MDGARDFSLRFFIRCEGGNKGGKELIGEARAEISTYWGTGNHEQRSRAPIYYIGRKVSPTKGFPEEKPLPRAARK